MPIDHNKLTKWFSPSSLPKVHQESQQGVDAIRFKARELAEAIIENTPPSADQSDAVRKVREATWAAAQAVICNR